MPGCLLLLCVCSTLGISNVKQKRAFRQQNYFVSKCQEMKDIAKRNPCNILVMKGPSEGLLVVKETNPKHI